ncbi:M6 family metalloprotease domain-containing protein [Paenibacillus sp. IHBB 10380]|uniref:M6 family metalloprotease domain-containing protein n=1 Tax=Paenibacillus sp. IHBB 10380 TaxID=1566358 RepID=UPI0005CFB81B|nr:M6 family metalloprotease domain-containing protein [Paenibacillus sp. IHBB 10380]AJS58646.1 metalloprotease [Paenibacillus sp. IHBB 10380]
MSKIDGEVLSFTHGNKEITLRVFGDEFYARYESLDGYTTIYDTDLKKYCYAYLNNGKLSSSGIDITDPSPSDLTRHIKEDPSIRSEKFSMRYNELRPKDEKKNFENNMRAIGPNNGLLEGRSITKGVVRGLTVLVEFSDLSSSVTVDDVSNMLNGDNYQENGNFCSVSEYYKLMSSGKLIYNNHVVGPVKLPNGIDYYKRNLLIKDAMDILVRDLNIDLSQFDSTNSKIVDAVNFLYAGRTVYEKQLWPHNSHADLEYNGYKIDLYMLSSLGRGPSDLSIGTFCHETGHLLFRFPDMYDYGERDGDREKSQGIGQYCLMGSGNHLNNGLTPSPVCSYLRDLAGWCENKIILNELTGKINVQHGDYNTILKYNTDIENEYFLVENRTSVDLDKHLPSSGLAVYHCDINGSNEYQAATPTEHYQCALIQADGNLDLENNRNPGDNRDLYGNIEGLALSYNTNPSSRQWNSKDSGLIISDISDSSMNIEFTLGSNV